MRRLLFGLLFCSPLFTFCANGQNSGDNDLQRGLYLTTDNQQPVQNVVVPALPKEAYFAGEKVPLEYFDVREALQRGARMVHGNLDHSAKCSLFTLWTKKSRTGILQFRAKKKKISPEITMNDLNELQKAK